MQLFVLCSCPYRTLGGCMLGYPGRCPGLIVDGLSARQPRCRSSVSSLSIIRSNFARWLTNQAFVLQTLVSNITLQSANRASRFNIPPLPQRNPSIFMAKSRSSTRAKVAGSEGQSLGKGASDMVYGAFERTEPSQSVRLSAFFTTGASPTQANQVLAL